MSLLLLTVGLVAGVIEPRLAIEERSWATFTFRPDSSAVRAHRGEIHWGSGRPATARIVESLDNVARLQVDLDRDGIFSPGEWVAFHPVDGEPLSRVGKPVAEARFTIRLWGKSFASLPLRVRIFDSARSILPHGGRVVSVSVQPFVRARIEVEGRPITLLYQYDVEADDADPRRGWLGFGGEWKYAENQEVHFALDGRQISTAAIDLRLRRVAVRISSVRD